MNYHSLGKGFSITIYIAETVRLCLKQILVYYYSIVALQVFSGQLSDDRCYSFILDKYESRIYLLIRVFDLAIM